MINNQITDIKTMSYDTLEIPKNSLDYLKVQNTLVMHEEANLLNDIGSV